MSHERRPDSNYFEMRTELFSQGDIFVDVPLAYPLPADEILNPGEQTEGSRRFISGPFDAGPAMLITPTCSMRAQGSDSGYAHPVRTLVPIRPVGELMEMGLLDEAKRGLADKRDSLINYMFIPALPDHGIEDSLAFLYMPVTLHHEIVADNRVAQLTDEAAKQLQKKLVWHSSSVLLTRADFEPPLD